MHTNRGYSVQCTCNLCRAWLLNFVYIKRNYDLYIPYSKNPDQDYSAY